MTDEPHSDRDAGGRFLRGHRLGGRPRGPDPRAVAAAAAEAAGTTLDEQVAAVLAALFTAAQEGDVPAAREWLDRIAGKVALAVRGEIETGPSFDELLCSTLGVDLADSDPGPGVGAPAAAQGSAADQRTVETSALGAAPPAPAPIVPQVVAQPRPRRHGPITARFYVSVEPPPEHDEFGRGGRP